MVKQLRLLLYPFSLIYATVLVARNFLFNCSCLSSYHPPVPSIVIGNLNTGGTGKTPHIELLIRLLSNKYKVAVLSRGYGRKTRGFIELDNTHSALEVGDEPLQFYQKFAPSIRVFVCENRALGAKNILQQHTDTQIILLDDAFQHRKIKGGLNILLSEYNRPFFKDFVLPAGNLREPIGGKERATICIYTKCPDNLCEKSKAVFAQKFDATLVKKTYFSSISYGNFSSFAGKTINTIKNILLLTGIANPKPLENYLTQNFYVQCISYPDHHNYNAQEITKIHKIFDNFAPGEKIILTTEKDKMRLIQNGLIEQLQMKPWYCIPITIHLDQEDDFNKTVLNYVEKAKRNA
jgi:tetraacyldisaccharide 4'-kinase